MRDILKFCHRLSLYIFLITTSLGKAQVQLNVLEGVCIEDAESVFQWKFSSILLL
jgi:hypothetical protein